MKLIVVVATVGRPELTRKTVELLADQTRRPDEIIVVSVSPKDVEGVTECRAAPTVIFSERGLCRQRNRALQFIGDRADIVVFFDDDFIPAPHYLERLEELFEQDPKLVGLTGELIADGIHNEGITFDEAVSLVRERADDLAPRQRTRLALYGCNMSIRLAAAQGLAFDENLPLYGWQEDIDFTYQLGKRGTMFSTTRITGVHMGVKGGRTSGKKLGYSQVANLVYLWRKGTMQPGLGGQLMRQNLVSNLLRSFWSEPHIDRRGRLLGNAIALFDWLTGRIDPRRIETM